MVTAYLPFFKSGQLIPLAVTSAKRTSLLPDVPSISELSSYRNLVLDNFFGISGPAKVPADMVARINTACNEILAQADIKKRMLDLGITVTPGSPTALTSYGRNQVAALASTFGATHAHGAVTEHRQLVSDQPARAMNAGACCTRVLWSRALKHARKRAKNSISRTLASQSHLKCQLETQKTAFLEKKTAFKSNKYGSN